MPEKLNLEEFPGDYPETDRNCFDCLHMRTKIPVKPAKNPARPTKKNDAQLGFYYAKNAWCRKEWLLRWSGKAKDEAFDPTYQIKFDKIAKGFRHGDWNFAGVCPDFTDMRDDDDVENRKEGVIPNHLHDSNGTTTSGVLQTMDSGRVEVGTDASGDPILPRREGQGNALSADQAPQRQDC